MTKKSQSVGLPCWNTGNSRCFLSEDHVFQNCQEFFTIARDNKKKSGREATKPTPLLGKEIIMVYNFVGAALTLADLEKAAIRETKKHISEGARESWDYFGFDREDEWKAVMLSSQVILITDESQDLNMADVCLDIDTFLLWLDGSHEERQKADEKERQFLEQQEQIGIKAEH